MLPGNTGRDYVLRKLIRRAVLDGGRLGKKAPFLYRLVPVVARVMEDQYPDLAERRENIARLIRIEEERFHQTLDRGQAILQELIEKLRAAGEKKLPGSEAFRLFDTYGLPLDVTQSLLEDEGMTTDADEFESEMGRQRERARKGTKISADIFGGGPDRGAQGARRGHRFRGIREGRERRRRHRHRGRPGPPRRGRRRPRGDDRPRPHELSTASPAARSATRGCC